MKPQTHSRSLAVLAQPVSFGALFLLLLNDFVLKKLWPSWLTGKLSDFTWLFVAPLALAALLALLPPFKKENREKWAGILSFSLIACGFALVKTLPAARDALLALWQRTAGFPIAVVVDPTDLLALAALILSGLLWIRQKPLLTGAFSRGWLVLPLLALLTIADAAAPDYGIACLAVQNGSIQAKGNYSDSAYASSDGGISWQPAALSSYSDCQASVKPGDAIVLPGQSLRFRFTAGASIEKSTDGGQTWQVDFKLTGNQQAQAAYQQKVSAGTPMVLPGPLDAVMDPATGNLVFAMGHEGVLVRSANGTWQWAAVGPYQHVEFSGDIPSLILLLGGEILLAIFLIFSLINTWLVRRRRWRMRIIHSVGLWLLWGISALVFPPALAYSYSALFSSTCLLLVAVIVIPFGVENLVFLARRSPQKLPQVILYALGGGVLFLLPYVLWALNAIPTYTLAVVFALVLALAVGVLGYLSIHRTHPDLSNP